MPIGLINKDSSYFSITSNDIDTTRWDFSRDIISFSLTERERTMPQGSITFNDPKHLYSRILRTGVKLNIEWGYKDNPQQFNPIIEKQINKDELTGQYIRRGYEGFISSPTGGGTQNGQVTYNCNFTGFTFRGQDENNVYTDGTKKDVIENAFNDLGISNIKRLINFTRGNESLQEYPVRQDESTYLFLVRLSYEWKCLFYVGFSSIGEPVGVFVDNNKAGETNLPVWITDATGKSNIIGYKGEINNVISYTWKSNESESGVGDNVQVEIVNGEIQFRKYVAEQEKVITYKLNTKKIQDVYEDRASEGIQSQAALTQELLSKKDFESIKHFFDPIEQETAPQGFGYRVSCKMIGNPLFTPTTEIILNNGFPDRITSDPNNASKLNKFYIESVTHNIDTSGYFMDVDIVDVFSISPIGQRL